ncbi:hypothetical protein BU52_19115 [Streptomyces toyocaensis]|uniref:Uncharacterized protein n=1 Tax=Streptomyces toyocaensis TaxID=55952 RepID=A0A081XQ11_STRTO|nr:hypothetical protein BU52_19115 [Streptomyces toyocaensis]
MGRPDGTANPDLDGDVLSGIVRTDAGLTAKKDPRDVGTTDDLGFPAISEHAPLRRGHVGQDPRRILRRPYTYDDAVAADGRAETGPLFSSFRRDIGERFLPSRRSPIGSAVRRSGPAGTSPATRLRECSERVGFPFVPAHLRSTLFTLGGPVR